MSPTEWRDVRQKIRRAIHSSVAASGDGFSKMLDVPVNDDGCEQVQPGHAEVLSFGCSVADFTLASDAQSILEGVMGLAFVEAELVGDVGVGFQSGFMAILGVDQIHRLTLARSPMSLGPLAFHWLTGEELPITGRGDTTATGARAGNNHGC